MAYASAGPGDRGRTGFLVVRRRVFASQRREAFIEGHLHAFAVLGGVSAGKVRYDNLRSAVSRVLMGRDRAESDRWVLFR
jgi:hypothetical protein